MQLDSLNHYFTKLDSVQKYNTIKKRAMNFLNFVFPLNQEKNSTSYLFKCVEEYPNEISSSLSIFNV